MLKTSARMLALLSLLQARRDWPGSELAHRLGVSPRTIRRDMDRLRELGYRIRPIKGPDGGYRLDAGEELPPLLFDDDQAIALTVALQSAALSAAGVEESAQRALATVRQLLPGRLRHRLDALQFSVTSPEAAPVDAAVLAEVSAAVHAQQELRFSYASAGREPDAGSEPEAPRRIQPHHLVATQGRWYLIGWDSDRDDWRILRVDRMRLRSHRGRSFTPRQVPGGDPRSFLRARFRGSRSEAWPCVGSVLVHAPAASVAPFADGGAVEAVTPDSCRLEAGAWSWGALAARLMQFEADLEVLSPPALAAAFDELSRRAARAAAPATPAD